MGSREVSTDRTPSRYLYGLVFATLASGGCRGMDVPPEQRTGRATEAWSEILRPDAFNGELTGFDPRARDIERNLGYE